MKNIEIDERLKNDTLHLGTLNGQTLLLLNNALVPWFIVLPNTDEVELYKLAASERSILEKNIDLLSGFLFDNFTVEKLNVATIGNIVSQMHMHIVGRHSSDFCWPNVVWGQSNKRPYEKSELTYITNQLSKELGNSGYQGITAETH